MNTEEVIERIIYDSVEIAVEGGDPPPRSATTVLVGEEACLDSMGVVKYVVADEDALKSELGISINLAEMLDTDPASPKPQITVGSLSTFLKLRLRGPRQ